MTNHSHDVTLIHRRDTLRAEKILQDRLFAYPKIRILWNREVAEFVAGGDPSSLVALELRDTRTGAGRGAWGRWSGARRPLCGLVYRTRVGAPGAQAWTVRSLVERASLRSPIRRAPSARWSATSIASLSWRPAGTDRSHSRNVGSVRAPTARRAAGRRGRPALRRGASCLRGPRRRTRGSRSPSSPRRGPGGVRRARGRTGHGGENRRGSTRRG